MCMLCFWALDAKLLVWMPFRVVAEVQVRIQYTEQKDCEETWC